MHSALAGLVAVAALLWLWRDSLRARELAARVCRRACEAEGVQFLDDTVALGSVRPHLARGRLALRRVYQFEFSRRGDDRHGGSVTVTGRRIETVYLSPPHDAPAPPPPTASVVRIEDARRRH